MNKCGTGEGKTDTSNSDQDAFCPNQLLRWQISSITLLSCKLMISLSIKAQYTPNQILFELCFLIGFDRIPTGNRK